MNETQVLLEKLEYIIGFSLPDSFKKLYLNKANEFTNIKLMDIKDIYNEMVDAIDNNDDYDDLYTIDPKNSILAKAYDKKRLPFITDGSGNYIGIDFNPGEEGVIGQIINYGRDEYHMKVFAYNFYDFIFGINQLKFNDNIYITDYLINNNIDFIKESKTIDESIKLISSNSLKKCEREEIKTNTIYEVQQNKELKMDDLKEIIDILSTMNKELLNDKNIKEFKNYWFHFRIINKKDSLSRTMENEESFYQKLDSYNKEEIKGFSFAITNYIEELCDNKILVGQEKIFVEMNFINNITTIRYTETIGNNIMKNTYEKIKNYFN